MSVSVPIWSPYSRTWRTETSGIFVPFIQRVSRARRIRQRMSDAVAQFPQLSQRILYRRIGGGSVRQFHKPGRDTANCLQLGAVELEVAKLAQGLIETFQLRCLGMLPVQLRQSGLGAVQNGRAQACVVR